MDAARRAEKISDVFSAALEEVPAARDAFVRERCRGDDAAAEEVFDLLAIHHRLEAADALLDDTADAFIGTTIGSYKVVRLLDEGGMGRVYLATRVDGSFQRDVAIKIIGDRFAQDLISRFEQERRILAALRHPHIAALFDAGMTTSGRMYFVMEYVDGRNLTAYCQEQELDLRSRIDVFTLVCDAVAHAHHKFVVHRDLKPANILVDGHGQPKLLDFGIAKMLTAASCDPDPTELLRRRLTPAYASPEQLEGRPAQTAIDVFALGIILYELLTDERPSRSDDGRSVLNRRPSERLQAKLPELLLRRRRGARVVLPSQLRGDLDAIVEKALAQDWRDRYRSVDALADDLRAWASHRPVEARHAGVVYRAGKFIRRNAALSTSATIAVLALLLAAGGLFQLWRQAKDARDRANARFEAVSGLAASMFEVERELAALDGATSQRLDLADSLREYLEAFSRTDDQRVLLETARAFQRLGDVEGNVNSSNLGRPNMAIAHYDRAIRILQSLGRPEGADVKVALATALASRGDVRAGQRLWDAAESDYRAALAELPETAPQPSATELSLAAGIHRALGDVYLRRESPKVALTLYERAEALNRRAARAGLASDEARRLEAVTQVRLGDARKDLGLLTEARGHYERAVTLLASLAGNMGHRDLKREAALSYARLAAAIKDAGADGRAEFERAIGMLRELSTSDEADARARRDLVGALVQYSDLLERADRRIWRATLVDARLLARRQVSEWPSDMESRTLLAAIEDRLAHGGTVSLQLVAVSDGKPIEAGEPLKFGQMLRAVANVPPGWSRYLLVFGAEGPAEIMDEASLAPRQWTFDIKGPTPAETVLLVASPTALTAAQRQALVTSIESVAEPRSIDRDSHIVWRDHTHWIESSAASRGKPDERRWTRTILRQMTTLKDVRVHGRTFPVLMLMP